MSSTSTDRREEEILSAMSKVERALSASLSITQEMRHAVDDQLPSADALILRDMNRYLTALSEMHGCCEALDKVQVPTEVIRMLDEGMHPDAYARDLATQAIREARLHKEQHEGLQRFKEAILSGKDLAASGEPAASALHSTTDAPSAGGAR
eukprot:CAMPEP_0196776770 /NCGR_PEP_ID=MMETSP1104-20130614/4829_1 /TAXON_ID=33652 /ORGANISM="Cafeteria sp., Strain Caron Lab Isolate" /LENGTH=151 /DNA_ID=CAMNT_0042146937 /DNA_START=72 /DNA_END=527 /DNA_ORIENTATION=-